MIRKLDIPKIIDKKIRKKIVEKFLLENLSEKFVVDAQIEKINLELDLLSAGFVAAQFAIADMVNRKLRTEILREIIIRRYGMLEKPFEVAQNLNLTVAQVYRLSRLAIKFLQRY